MHNFRGWTHEICGLTHGFRGRMHDFRELKDEFCGLFHEFRALTREFRGLADDFYPLPEGLFAWVYQFSKRSVWREDLQ